MRSALEAAEPPPRGSEAPPPRFAIRATRSSRSARSALRRSPARAEAAAWAAEEIKAYADEARKERRAAGGALLRRDRERAAAGGDGFAAADAARAESELPAARARGSETRALLEEARARIARRAGGDRA